MGGKRFGLAATIFRGEVVIDFCSNVFYLCLKYTKDFSWI